MLGERSVVIAREANFATKTASNVEHECLDSLDNANDRENFT